MNNTSSSWTEDDRLLTTLSKRRSPKRLQPSKPKRRGHSHDWRHRLSAIFQPLPLAVFLFKLLCTISVSSPTNGRTGPKRQVPSLQFLCHLLSSCSGCCTEWVTRTPTAHTMQDAHTQRGRGPPLPPTHPPKTKPPQATMTLYHWAECARSTHIARSIEMIYTTAVSIHKHAASFQCANQRTKPLESMSQSECSAFREGPDASPA